MECVRYFIQDRHRFRRSGWGLNRAVNLEDPYSVLAPALEIGYPVWYKLVLGTFRHLRYAGWWTGLFYSGHGVNYI